MSKLSAVVATVAALVSSSAFAADMPLKAPLRAPGPIVSWTGFYVGGNVGYGWGDPRTNVAGSATTFSFPGVFADTPAGFPSTIAFADSNTARLRGAIGGAQFGYNYQINSRWVLGLEADFQGSSQTGSNASIDQLSGAICTGASAAPAPSHYAMSTTTPFIGSWTATETEAKIGWFGTFRGRVGFLITDQVLVYGTGGLAYGRVEVSGTSTPSSTATFFWGSYPLCSSRELRAFSAAKTNAGYAAGGGVEGKLLPWLPANWTWKLEYLYLDLGSLNSSAPFGGTLTNFPGVNTPATGAVAIHTHFFDNIVRVGLNYKIRKLTRAQSSRLAVFGGLGMSFNISIPGVGLSTRNLRFSPLGIRKRNSERGPLTFNPATEDQVDDVAPPIGVHPNNFRELTSSSRVQFDRHDSFSSGYFGRNMPTIRAEREAAARRTTERQILEDAGHLITVWNERQAKRMPMLFSPTIGTAITAGYRFLARAARPAVDLRGLNRHHGTAMPALTPTLSCRSRRPNAAFAELVRLSKWAVTEEYYAERNGNRWVRERTARRLAEAAGKLSK